MKAEFFLQIEKEIRKTTDKLASPTSSHLRTVKRKKIISSGIVPLDYRLSGGFRRGIYIISVPVASFKTTLALNIGRNIAANGIPILFFNLDLTGPEEIICS